MVADEVRSLAQRSAAAAKETADKIEAAIVNSRKGSQCTAKVEESLTQIAEKVSSTDALVAEIATAAREQAQGIEQINAAIAQMDKVSQSNSASAEESASAAEELDAQAETLKDLVAKLRLLVGGKSDTVSPTPVYPARLLTKTTPAITSTGRRAIPMPEDSGRLVDEHSRIRLVLTGDAGGVGYSQATLTTSLCRCQKRETSERLSAHLTRVAVLRPMGKGVPAAKAVRAI